MISSLTSWQSPTVNDMQLFDDNNGIMNGIKQQIVITIILHPQ